jgi:hypothetical protein
VRETYRGMSEGEDIRSTWSDDSTEEMRAYHSPLSSKVASSSVHPRMLTIQGNFTTVMGTRDIQDGFRHLGNRDLTELVMRFRMNCRLGMRPVKSIKEGG